MATYQEAFEKLNAMSEEVFSAFRKEYGGDLSRIQYAELLIRDPGKEPVLCQALGLKTEQQKLNDANIRASDAAVDSAESARRSASASERSANWSFWAVVISIGALVVSAIGVYISSMK